MLEAKDMTLRDWFAGKAMQVLLSGDPDFLKKVIGSDNNAPTFACYAFLAYEMADAMMEEKEESAKDAAHD